MPKRSATRKAHGSEIGHRLAGDEQFPEFGLSCPQMAAGSFPLPFAPSDNDLAARDATVPRSTGRRSWRTDIDQLDGRCIEPRWRVSVAVWNTGEPERHGALRDERK
jgi:hypothetical protein